MTLRTQLTEVVEPVVLSAGYELDALTVNRAGRRHLVRVTVDGDEGVDSGAIATLAQTISAALDEAEAESEAGELVAGQYTLEVSSPGVDRPLTAPRHWRRNVGRLVKVKLGDRVVTGRVLAADDGGVSLDVGGTVRTAAYPELGPGHVEIEFNRPGTDGGPGGLQDQDDPEDHDDPDNDWDDELDDLDEGEAGEDEEGVDGE